MLEKEIEDWVIEHVEDVVGTGAVVVARQYRLPTGRILDVLVRHHFCPFEEIGLAVVEVKRGTADGAALLQLMDYMNELHLMFHGVRGILVARDFTQEVHRSKPQTPTFWVDLVQFRPAVEFFHPRHFCHQSQAWDIEKSERPPLSDLHQALFADIQRDREEAEKAAQERMREFERRYPIPDPGQA